MVEFYTLRITGKRQPSGPRRLARGAVPNRRLARRCYRHLPKHDAVPAHDHAQFDDK